MKAENPQIKKLIVALEAERDIMVSKWSKSPNDHNEAIDYLKTGIIPKYYKEYVNDILDAAINDFDCLYSDYVTG